MLATGQPEQILSRLGKDAAFLADGQILYFSRGPEPVARLIQGIYDLRPEQARRILRARIYSATPPSEFELGMVRVAAKRMSAPVTPLALPADTEAPSGRVSADPVSGFVETVEIRPEPPPPLLDPSELPGEIAELLEKREFMRAAVALSERIPKRAQLYQSDRRVAALLVSGDDRLLAAAINSNARNRTRHAELNLVQAFLAAGNPSLPRGSRIYVTLKCCKMCAAGIWCAAEDVSELRIFYAEEDTGPNARFTVFTPFSFERKRASRSERELSLELEFRRGI